jgi:uncharacterized protein YcbK (DUF882 family)
MRAPLMLLLLGLPAAPAMGTEAPRTLEVLEGDTPSEPETFETFSIISVNTNETTEIRMVRGYPTASSYKALSHILRCLRTEREAEMAPELVAILFELARRVQAPMELISGYRVPHGNRRNYHERAQAADVRFKGVPAQVLFGVARKMNIPGLGIYPVSGMIHVDVRETPYRWVDYSPPWHRSSAR